MYFQVRLFTWNEFYTIHVFDVEAYTHTATTNTLKYLYIIYILKYFTQLQTIGIIELYTF